jgi:hypothetical protein
MNTILVNPWGQYLNSSMTFSMIKNPKIGEEPKKNEDKMG